MNEVYYTAADAVPFVLLRGAAPFVVLVDAEEDVSRSAAAMDKRPSGTIACVQA